MSPEILEKTRHIVEICRMFGVALQAAALQFPLGHPAVSAVIPGATSREMVAANVAHFKASIPPEFWAELKERGLLVADAPVPEGEHEI